MFGYIKPVVGELKVKNYELYKATYCGLCRTMGKCTGCMSKLTLNYDFVFLVLIRKVFEKSSANIKMRRCLVHPFKKRPMMEIDDTLRYSARSSVILTKMKLKDNINDSHGLKKIKARVAGLLSVFLKRTPKDYTDLESDVKNCIEKLSDVEKSNEESVDIPASIFGELLSYIASYNLEGEVKDIASKIGYHLGKWIYIIDACDDMKSDIKTGSYNPVVNSFGKDISESDRDIIKCALMIELDEMSKYFDMLDYSNHMDVKEIIDNIIHDGMIKQTENFLYNGEK